MVKDLYLIGICCCVLGLTQGASEKQRLGRSISDQLKRDGNPNPNDLFWANRGKKSSSAPHPDSSDDDMVYWAKPQSYVIPERLRRNFPAMRPNSFMNMYMNPGEKNSKRMPKRGGMAMMKALRPNSFLFPSMSQNGKRNGQSSLWNVARPNSHLFPQLSGRGRKRANGDGPSRSLRPNSFNFPIPKRHDFFAGRGKRGDDEETVDEDQMMEKRADMSDDTAFFAGRGKKDMDMAEANFFAGRGKKSDDDVAAFFAGRGKKSDDDVASFFAGRGKKSDEDIASFFAGRGKRGGEEGVDVDMTFFAGRGKREANAKEGTSSEEDKAIFWAVRG